MSDARSQKSSQTAGEDARAPRASESNYHERISDEFIAVRGFGFALSPVDLAVIDEWERRGVPLSIPLAVIADISDRVTFKGGRRPRSLAYIREEVEARFAELVEGHVGCGGCERPYCSRRRAA